MARKKLKLRVRLPLNWAVVKKLNFLPNIKIKPRRRPKPFNPISEEQRCCSFDDRLLGQYSPTKLLIDEEEEEEDDDDESNKSNNSGRPLVHRTRSWGSSGSDDRNIAGLVLSILNGTRVPGKVDSSYQLLNAKSQLEEKKKTLSKKLGDLQSMEEDVISELEVSEKDTDNRRKNEVVNWLGNVERIKEEAGSMLRELEESKSNSQMGNRAQEIIQRLSELIDQKYKFQGRLVIHKPAVIQIPRRNKHSEDFFGEGPSP